MDEATLNDTEQLESSYDDSPIEPSSGYDEILEIANTDVSEETSGGLLNPNDFLKKAPSQEEPAEKEEEQKESEAPKEEVTEKEDPKEEKPESTAKEPKTYEVLSVDGKKVMIPDSVKLRAKIEGEEKEFTLAEAVRHFQFDVPHNKMIQQTKELRNKLEKEIKAKETEIAQKQEEFESRSRNMGQGLLKEMKALSEGNIPGFITAYAESRQASPAAVHSKLREFFIQEANDWFQADEYGKKALDLEAENRYLKEENNIRMSQQQLVQNYQANQTMAIQAQEQSGLSLEDWTNAEEVVIRDVLKGKSPTAEDIARWTPDITQEYVRTIIAIAEANKHNSRITDIVLSAVPTLRDSNPDKYEELLAFAKRFSDYDDEKLSNIVKVQAKAFSSKSEQSDEEVVTKFGNPSQKPASRSDSGKSVSYWGNDDEDDDDPLSVYR